MSLPNGMEWGLSPSGELRSDGFGYLEQSFLDAEGIECEYGILYLHESEDFEIYTLSTARQIVTDREHAELIIRAIEAPETLRVKE